MEAVKVVGGLFFWGIIIGGLYLKTVETSSASRSSNTKRNRFLAMLLLWLIIPVLGGGILGGLVADTAAPEWVMFAVIGVAILVPWLLAIRLQIKWGRAERALYPPSGVSAERVGPTCR